jgi:flagellar basal body-associated protein FliL
MEAIILTVVLLLLLLTSIAISVVMYLKLSKKQVEAPKLNEEEAIKLASSKAGEIILEAKN